MKKLLLAGALVVGLSIPAFAVDGIQGGYVATSAADALTVQKLNSDKQSKGGYVATSAADALTVQKLSSNNPGKHTPQNTHTTSKPSGCVGGEGRHGPHLEVRVGQRPPCHRHPRGRWGRNRRCWTSRWT